MRHTLKIAHWSDIYADALCLTMTKSAGSELIREIELALRSPNNKARSIIAIDLRVEKTPESEAEE